MKLIALSLLVLTLSLPGLAQADGSTYAVRTVDFPGAANTAIYAINDRNEFVGALKDSSGAHHAFAGRGSQLAPLDPTGPIGQAAQSWAYSINNEGDIAGALIDGAGRTHGFVRRSGGGIELFDVPDGIDTQAYGINDRGSVIGVYVDAAKNPRAFVWRFGRYQPADLPGALQTVPLSINDAEEIVGEYLVSNDTLGYGYLQRRDGRYSLASAPGAAPQQTYFISINNRGAVLGSDADAAGQSHNFIRRHGHYRAFDLPAALGAGYVSAQTINDEETVVGYYFDAANVAHGFVATRAERDDD